MAVRKPPAERPGTPLSNRNFLAPTGFKFSLKRSPAAAFFCNQANIPSMDLGVATQPTYLKDTSAVKYSISVSVASNVTVERV